MFDWLFDEFWRKFVDNIHIINEILYIICVILNNDFEIKNVFIVNICYNRYLKISFLKSVWFNVKKDLQCSQSSTKIFIEKCNNQVLDKIQKLDKVLEKKLNFANFNVYIKVKRSFNYLLNLNFYIDNIIFTFCFQCVYILIVLV